MDLASRKPTALAGCCIIVAPLCLLVTFAGCSQSPPEGPVPRPLGETRVAVQEEESPFTLEEIAAAAKKIEDAGGAIKRNASGQVVEVDLISGRSSATDEIAQAILLFTKLQKLKIAGTGIKPQTLEKFAALVQLDELMLHDVPITDEQLNTLVEELSELARLSLRRCPITDEGIEGLAQTRKLKALALIEMMSITGQSLDALTRMTSLRSLDLRSSQQLSGEDYRKLVALPWLTEVKIGGYLVDDSVLATLAKLPSATSITIEDAEITTQGMKALVADKRFAGQLRSLSLARDSRLQDASLEVLSGFTALQNVTLNEIPVTGTFMASLNRSGTTPPLESLRILNSYIADEYYVHLTQFASTLRQLDLAGAGLSPDSLKSIGQLNKLESLNLANCDLDDEAIRPLASLVELRRLDLSGNARLTEASWPLFESLAGLKTLKLKDTALESKAGKR